MSGSSNPFNPAHPPLMTNVDVLPSSPTESKVIGSHQITSKFFDLVIDPQYPWQNMHHSSPDDWQKWKHLKQDQINNVDHYLVVRTQRWELLRRRTYANDVSEVIDVTIGVIYVHEKMEQQSITERIGADLGLNLTGGNLFSGGGADPEIPPIPALMNSTTALKEGSGGGGEGGGGEGGGSGGGSFNLSYELSKSLEYRQTDTTTYDVKRQTNVTTQFKAGYQYLTWQVMETLSLYRVRKGAKPGEREFISAIEAGTSTIYNDSILMKPTTDPSTT